MTLLMAGDNTNTSIEITPQYEVVLGYWLKKRQAQKALWLGH
jgi:hypothetical protein